MDASIAPAAAPNADAYQLKRRCCLHISMSQLQASGEQWKQYDGQVLRLHVARRCMRGC